jgi:hypothetical protein
MIRMARIPVGLSLVLLGFAVGCQQQPMTASAPTVARVSVENDQQFDELWDTTADVLRAHYMWPDRMDRANRVMTTHYDTSPSFFEFWWPFPTSEFRWWQANLDTVRRKATVRFVSADKPDEVEMQIEVDVSKFELPERQVTSSAAAFQFFGAKLPTTEGQLASYQRDAYWTPDGRDPMMEFALLDRILTRYGAEGYEIIPAETAEEPTTQPASESQ